MMVIDSHQHFWIFDSVRDSWINEDMQVIRKDFLPEQLAPILKANDVDACIAIQADQSEAETQFLIELAKQHPFIKGVVGWVDLQAENIEEKLAYYTQFESIKGFRHIVQAEPDRLFLLREHFCRGIVALSKYNYTYDILIKQEQLPMAEKFVKKFPGQRFMLDHLAKPAIKTGNIGDWQTGIKKLAQYPNVYCKLSGLITEANWNNWSYDQLVTVLDTAFVAFGANRLLFGSDWPVCLLAGSYQQVKQYTEQYIVSLSQHERDAIMGNNALNFYNIKD